MLRVASHLIRSKKIEDSFYIADMNKLRANIAAWFNLMPSVIPYYAIKCNPDNVVLDHLVKDGRIGFDCASTKEMATVISKGVSPDKVIFAHPCKKKTDMVYANKHGIKLTVFDNKYELQKIREAYSQSDVLLRIRIDNPKARVQLGLKYGADEHEWDDLLKRAIDSGVNVKGVSFHIGSASKDALVFQKAIAKSLNIISKYPQMNLLDIGGGFQKQNFQESAIIINKMLDGVPMHVIAEPGRYFVEDVFTFFTPIIGLRLRNTSREYFIADGLYGSLNCLLYDKHVAQYEAVYNPLLSLQTEIKTRAVGNCRIWGSTCDSADLVLDNATLPDNLRVGDFIMFKNFGAYTLAGACDFNGINFTKPHIEYIQT